MRITGQWCKALRGGQVRTGAADAAINREMKQGMPQIAGGLGKGQGEDDPQEKQHTEQYAEGGSA